MSAQGTCYEDANGDEIKDGDLLADSDELFAAKPKYRVIWQRGYEQWYAEHLDEDDPFITPLFMIADECVIVERSD